MTHPTGVYAGVDLAVKRSQIATLDAQGQAAEMTSVFTTRAGLTRWFGKRAPMRIVLEAGGSSPWVDRLLRELGHQVIVVNPRRVRLIAESTLKTDAVDAAVLAHLARLAPDLFLRPITPREEATQRGRGLLRVRHTRVKARTASVNTVRGLLRSFGYTLPAGGVGQVAERVAAAGLPAELAAMVAPLGALVTHLTTQLAALEAEVEALGATHPAVALLQEIPGVGPLVALAFVLCVEDPQRFARARDVGPYLGLRPTVRSSGQQHHQGRITKEGDALMRALLVQAAHVLLQSRTDSALKQWGLGLAARIGKKKAVIAVARKLGVVMLRVWQTGEVYRPFPEARRDPAAADRTA